MTYQEMTTRLGVNTERVLTQLVQRMQAGDITRDEFATLGATLIARSNSEAHHLAELRLATIVSEAGGEGRGSGLPMSTSAMDIDRLADALRTATEDDDTAETRVARIARSEPVRTGQATLGRAMAASVAVIGYRRMTNPGACELCSWLAGSVYPPGEPFNPHPGCECVAVPVLRPGLRRPRWITTPSRN